MADNQDLFKRLNELRGKHEFLKLQKADNEAKKKQLTEELIKLGLSDLNDLRKLVEKSTKEVEAKEAALVAMVASTEDMAKGLDARVKGQLVAPVVVPPPQTLPPLEISL